MSGWFKPREQIFEVLMRILRPDWWLELWVSPFSFQELDLWLQAKRAAFFNYNAWLQLFLKMLDALITRGKEWGFKSKLPDSRSRGMKYLLVEINEAIVSCDLSSLFIFLSFSCLFKLVEQILVFEVTSVEIFQCPLISDLGFQVLNKSKVFSFFSVPLKWVNHAVLQFE